MLAELDKKIIQELQEDLPVAAHPYQGIAEKLGVSEELIVERLRELVKDGYIRRFGVALRHREVGITANGMGTWNVPEEQAEEVGQIMASFPEVTHCYQRPRFPGWDYSHYTMIHGQSREECQEVAQRISLATGIKDYRLLFSTAELKKISMRYFTEDEKEEEAFA